MGAENATRNQRRTAATVAALIVALATVTAVASYATSWQAATSAALTGSVHADLIVRHATAVGQESTFNPKLAAELRSVDGVRQVVEVRTGRARVQGTETAIDAVDPDALGQVLGCGYAPAASPGWATPRSWSRRGRHAGTPSASGTR